MSAKYIADEKVMIRGKILESIANDEGIFYRVKIYHTAGTNIFTFAEDKILGTITQSSSENCNCHNTGQQNNTNGEQQQNSNTEQQQQNTNTEQQQNNNPNAEQQNNTNSESQNSGNAELPNGSTAYTGG